MFNNVTKPFLAIMVCCVIFIFSFVSNAETTKEGHFSSYIDLINLKTKNNALNLSNSIFSLEWLSDIERGEHLNLGDLSLTKFVLLLVARTDENLTNYEEDYRTILKKQKETLLQSIDFNKNEGEEQERIQAEIEKDVTDFLEELLENSRH